MLAKAMLSSISISCRPRESDSRPAGLRHIGIVELPLRQSFDAAALAAALDRDCSRRWCLSQIGTCLNAIEFEANSIDVTCPLSRYLIRQ